MQATAGGPKDAAGRHLVKLDAKAVRFVRLTVTATAPTLGKSIAPPVIAVGGTATLTLTLAMRTPLRSS